MCDAVRRRRTPGVSHVVEVHKGIVPDGVPPDVRQRAVAAADILLIRFPRKASILQLSREVLRRALMITARVVIVENPEVLPRFEPQIVWKARVDSCRVEVLLCMGGPGKQNRVDV